MNPVLVIGYGNTIRGDDGAGIRAAEELALRCPGHMKVLTSHGLAPELAEEIARSAAVVFIDASSTAERVEVHPVAPDGAGSASPSPHLSSPSALLGLSRSLYGTLPGESILVEIPARSFELGERLSADTQRFVDEAVALLVDRYRHP